MGRTASSIKWARKSSSVFWKRDTTQPIKQIKRQKIIIFPQKGLLETMTLMPNTQQPKKFKEKKMEKENEDENEKPERGDGIEEKINPGKLSRGCLPGIIRGESIGNSACPVVGFDRSQ